MASTSFFFSVNYFFTKYKHSINRRLVRRLTANFLWDLVKIGKRDRIVVVVNKVRRGRDSPSAALEQLNNLKEKKE